MNGESATLIPAIAWSAWWRTVPARAGSVFTTFHGSLSDR